MTIIVDEHDREIGAKERHDILSGDIYRVSALWLTNSKGEILLAKRAPGMRNDPDTWASAAAGTVDAGETYDDNIVKEIEEELGLKDLVLRRGPKLRNQGRHHFFVQWYFGVHDVAAEDIQFQKEEVSAVRWIAEEDLLREVAASPESFTSTPQKWKERVESFGGPLNPPPFVVQPGQKDYTDDPRPRTINCIAECGGEILLVKRNSKMNTYPGLWNGIAGYLDDERSPLEKAKEELREEASIGEDRIIGMREGPAIELEDAALGKTWLTHPIAATIDRKGVILDWEAEDGRWVAPEEVRNYDVIPGFERIVASFFP